ncbi:SpoIID/LytB domain-containing protein [Prevotella sp. 10(H)]|uniref:SpoIID/LytB domain-containing protein n=1 Tax=Prevotella sp. 10(H) TaxID=1158294 RepID=UPI0004A765A5|nr:SpoIID/LytB domain-containing protein [Prevotella sp. 10(H)]
MEPKVNVGILWNKEITFLLDGEYVCDERKVSGEHTVSYKDNQILWNGQIYNELLFTPQTEQSTFILRDVVIGINFHWERKEEQRFQGDLKLIVANGMITAINLIGIEDYLTSVISSEMSATASAALLKSHAVISRSWLLAQIEKNKHIIEKKENYTAFTETEDEIIRWYDREDHTDFDVCADDHCQRYQGITRVSANVNVVRKAIEETRGLVLKYAGEICDTRFSKCCGGVVEEFQNCWEDIKHPYLSKLRDTENENDILDLTKEDKAARWIESRPAAFCNTQDKKILRQVLNNYDQETTDFYRWQVVYTQEELSALIYKRSGIDFGTIEELIPVERGASGRLIKLKIVGSKKTMTIGKELEIRRILSESHLYSSAFTIKKHDGSFILRGAGWGHGVGLCQIGAAVMGEKGYTFDRILLHYYRGASLEKLY